jgi:hypothetical protein
MTGYEAFCIYNALKMHFTTDSYDYFKYNGKTRVSIDAFENRKDKYYFYKLSRRNSKEDYIEFLVSNFIQDENVWVGTLLTEDALTIHRERMKIIQSLTYTINDDLAKMLEKSSNPNELLVVNDTYPKLLNMVLYKEIKLETVCILNSLMNFFPMWNKNIRDTIRWPQIYKKCLKYTPFIQFDKQKFKTILLEKIK